MKVLIGESFELLNCFRTGIGEIRILVGLVGGGCMDRYCKYKGLRNLSFTKVISFYIILGVLLNFPLLDSVEKPGYPPNNKTKQFVVH